MAVAVTAAATFENPTVAGVVMVTRVTIEAVVTMVAWMAGELGGVDRVRECVSEDNRVLEVVRKGQIIQSDNDTLRCDRSIVVMPNWTVAENGTFWVPQIA